MHLHALDVPLQAAPACAGCSSGLLQVAFASFRVFEGLEGRGVPGANFSPKVTGVSAARGCDGDGHDCNKGL